MPRFQARPYSRAHQAVADLDWNPNSTHSFSAKYYYQHDPTIAPFAYSMVAGFAQHLDAGSQVISLSHTQIVKSNLSITETFGFIREKAYSTMDQPFTPAQFASACQAMTGCDAADCTINTFGSSFLPRHQHGVRRDNVLRFLSLLDEYRRRGGFPGSVYGSFPEPLQSLRQCHLDAWASTRSLSAEASRIRSSTRGIEETSWG